MLLASAPRPAPEPRLTPVPPLPPPVDTAPMLDGAPTIGTARHINAPTMPYVAETPVTFEALYDEYYAFVARTVRRLGVAEHAVEDVCQEAFVVVYRRMHEFEGRAKIKTWVYRITANVVANQNRAQRRKAPHQRSGARVDPEELAISTPGPEATARQTQAAHLARNILMNMSEPKRMAFVLVELEGMSYGEAGAALNETFDTVRARVRAARNEFAHQVKLLESVRGEVNHV
jgi:RNA polymerase sigma-70 factor, ECF subfamily